MIEGVIIAGLLLLFAPVAYDGIRSASQKRSLQNRSDYPEIAAACASLARSVTNDSASIPLTDPRVPAVLRSLSPRYIGASTDFMTLEFHGGLKHYGYRLRQSATNRNEWTLFYFAERSEKPLTTITND